MARSFSVLGVDAKVVFLDFKGKRTQVSIDKVKPYVVEDNPSSSPTTVTFDNPFALSEAPPTHTPMLGGDLEMQPADDHINVDEFLVELVLHDAGPQILLTEVLSPNDSRSNDSVFIEAKQKEIDGLKSRSTWSVISKAMLPKYPNILGGRFVLTYKGVGTDSMTAKSRYVAKGFNDKEKDFVVHNTSSLNQNSVKVIVSFAAVKGF